MHRIFEQLRRHTLRAALAAGAMGGLVGVAAGCGGARGAPENPIEAAEYAWLQAEDQFERRNFEVARSRYARVYQDFPYSQYAALSELRMGDCFFEERAWARAIEAYTRFVRFHPNHARVEEAQFKASLAHYRQMPTESWFFPPVWELDLVEARNALNALRAFVDRYGTSDEFGSPARDRLAEVRNRLALHELYVAEYYARHNNPRASARRALYLVETYPTATTAPRALFLAAVAMVRLGDVSAALDALQRLEQEYPSDPFVEEARRWREQHGL
jgi:outer membrane protein assembly factor BamD